MKRSAISPNGRLLAAAQLLVGLVCLVVMSRPSAATAESTVPTKSWTLYHTTFLDTSDDSSVPAFVPRGRIQLKLSQGGDEAGDKTAQTAKKPGAAASDNTLGPLQVTLEEQDEALTNDLMQSLLQPGAWYQLKLVPDGDESSAILTTVPACQVRRANFRDEFVLSLSNKAKILSLAYIPLVSPLAPKSCSDYESNTLPEGATFQSTLSMETAIPGMTLRTVLPDYQPPPGLTMIKGAARNRNGGGPQTLGGDDEKTAPPDNSPFGFIKRYWYILLPMFLMQVMGSEPPPPPDQQQQQQQGGPGGQQQQQLPPQGAGGTAGAPVAGAAAPQGTARKRRGKRG